MRDGGCSLKQMSSYQTRPQPQHCRARTHLHQGLVSGRCRAQHLCRSHSHSIADCSCQGKGCVAVQGGLPPAKPLTRPVRHCHWLSGVELTTIGLASHIAGQGRNSGVVKSGRGRELEAEGSPHSAAQLHRTQGIEAGLQLRGQMGAPQKKCATQAGKTCGKRCGCTAGHSISAALHTNQNTP